MCLLSRLTAAVLSAALLAPAAFAVEDPARERREDLDFLCTALQQAHPGFDALVDKEVFAARKAEIEAGISAGNDISFALDLQSLVALLGDSHTTTNLSPILNVSPLYPVSLTWYDGAWVLQALPAEEEAFLGGEVMAVNGLSMEEVVSRMAALVSADNPVKLRRQTQQVFPSHAVLSYLGIVPEEGPMTLTVRTEEGERTLTLTALAPEDFAALDSDDLARLSDRRTGLAPTARDGSRYYFALPLSERAYYIQYNTCQEDPELPMETFAAQVADDWAAGGYDTLLVDLRWNGGGSDGVLYPILEWAAGLVREGAAVYGLIGEATFSSAIINAVELQELGAVLAGSPTSGSADHYGSTRSFSLPHSGIRVSCSGKFIDLESLFEAGVGLGVESLQPDFAAEQTLADALAGRDTLVNALLALETPFVPAARPDAPLTRGGMARLLCPVEAAAGEVPFDDVFPISRSAPAIAWCAQAGVVQGDGAGAFFPARPVTLQEGAAMLHRLAGSPAAQGKTPAGTAPWAAQAMAWLDGKGLLPAGVSPTDPLTLAQGQALLAALG